ncbi:uncharacterized protein LOC143626527 [Bidens hawaiensis]|uniref:uncharacterized protein LOC143626527 n=1 Tax=Bidens hawaiensis TaxID=980011 RepID=UPI00404B1037
MVFEDCIARLKAFEERIKGKEAMAEMRKLLYAKYDNQGKKVTDHDRKNYARGRGSSGYDQRGHGRGCGQGRDKSGVWCYNCNVLGHFAWECPRSPTQETNLNQAEANPPTLMMTSVEVNKEQVMLNEEKVHPFHYANDSVSDSICGGLVKFGDGYKVNIKGRGSVIFDCKNGEQRVMNDVYYIPDLCSNILSIGQLTEEGCKVWIANDHLWLYEERDRLLMRVLGSPSRLYKIELRIETPEVELEHSLKVKALRSDRDGEFLNKIFTEYCHQEGIKRMFTALYSPQQNGVVERRNRKVLNATRSMMKAMDLPQNL